VARVRLVTEWLKCVRGYDDFFAQSSPNKVPKPKPTMNPTHPIICNAVCVSTLILSGCATPQAVPQVVKVPYAVPCIEAANVPVMPVILADSELAKADDFALVIALATERIALRQYAKEAAAVITGCVKP